MKVVVLLMEVCLHTLFLKVVKLLLVLLCQEEFCEEHGDHVRDTAKKHPPDESQTSLTRPVGAAVLLSLPADGRQHRHHVTEQDQRGGQDGFVVICQDEMVSLVFPHQI